MKWIILILLLAATVEAKVWNLYPPPFEEQADYRDVILLPHLYPGESYTTHERFLEEPLRPGTKIVRWTAQASYSILLDKVHLLRNSYTLRIKSRYGWQIRQLPFETTKLYLAPDYYRIRIDETTDTVWLAQYAEK